MTRYYSTLEVCKLLDTPKERLRDWMNRQFIVPSVSATGQGTKAEFSFDDICMVALFEFLLNFGLDRNTSASFVGSLKMYSFPRIAKENRELRWIVIKTKGNDSIDAELITSEIFSSDKEKKMIDLETGLVAGVPRYWDQISPEEKNGPGMPYTYYDRGKYVDGQEVCKKMQNWDAILIINFQELLGKVSKAVSKE